MTTDIALLPLWYVAFLFSIIVHEAAHAWAGKVLGDSTSEDQVTLNPLPHIKQEPMGTVAIPLISLFLNGYPIGWASAPYNPYWAVNFPRKHALVALAGPVSNFILAILAAVLIHLGLGLEVFLEPNLYGFGSIVAGSSETWQGLAIFLNIMLSLNLLLGLFNLLPVPPLDGISVLGLFLPEDQAIKVQELARNPQFSMIGMILAWLIGPKVIGPLFYWGLKALFII